MPKSSTRYLLRKDLRVRRAENKEKKKLESFPGRPSDALVKRFWSSGGPPATLLKHCRERFHACLHARRH
eukprot:6391898-Pyramimonas_sp.AAC.1